MFRLLLLSLLMVFCFIFTSCNLYTKSRSESKPEISVTGDNGDLSYEKPVEDTIKNIIEIRDSSNYVNAVSVQDSVTLGDSTINEYDYSRLYGYKIVDTLQVVDTISAVDTLPVPGKKKSGMEFDYPIKYDCEDRGMMDFVNRKAYLYGNAVVVYEDIKLTADYMVMDFENNEVFAHGLLDSLGNVTGKPVFQEGDEPFVADTIRYNFKTKKGLVKNVTTEFDGSYLRGGRTKMQPNRHVHMKDGIFTTCDLEHPHFYFKISKAKVIPDDRIIAGPSYLVLEDVPTPLGIPFGFFPNKKGAASGIIIPEIGDEESRGFFLKQGGYYWAINDNIDLTFLGSIFSKGSWAVGLKSNYKIRYKFDGYLNVNYNENKFGYSGLPGTYKERLYSVIWKFNQDQKARPNSRFSADVNISSGSYDKTNSNNIQNILTTNKQSSISYSRTFPNSPFNLSASLGQYQNNSSGEVNYTLPNVSFSMSTIYPLKRRVKVGETRWYEKVGLSYNMRLENYIKTNQDSAFKFNLDNMSNGISHSIPIKTSFKFLKYTTVTPSFTYNERWYLKTMEKYWEDTSATSGKVVSRYVPGFAREWDYNASLDWTTQLYGTFNFKGKIKAIRHMMTPTVGLSFRPDFGKSGYNFYEEYYRLTYNEVTGINDTIYNSYSRFEGLPFSRTPNGGSGTIRFSLGNNLEMKLRNKNDTTNSDRKVKILESLSLNTSYNIFAESFKWAPLTISGRTQIKFLKIDFSAVLDPYAYQKNSYGNYERVDKFLVTIDSTRGKLARLTDANISFDFTLKPKSSKKSDSRKIPYQYQYGYPHQYVDFDIPWELSFYYTLRYNKQYAESNVTQTLNISGNLSLTPKWKISFTSGYDIKMKKISPTSINVHRDLHCWEASLYFIPFGPYRQYRFQINVKSAMLQDLKLKKERSVYDSSFY